MADGSHPLSYVGPGGGVSGGLEAVRSKGVLGFDGIKVDRMTDKLLYSYPPMQCKRPPLPLYTWSME